MGAHVEYGLFRTAAEIFELDVVKDRLAPITEGHFRGELWGTATHPKKGQFVSVGDDETLRLWDITAKARIARVKLPTKARAVAYAPNGVQVAVGLFNGSFAVYSADLSKTLAQQLAQ